MDPEDMNEYAPEYILVRRADLSTLIRADTFSESDRNLILAGLASQSCQLNTIQRHYITISTLETQVSPRTRQQCY